MLPIINSLKAQTRKTQEVRESLLEEVTFKFNPEEIIIGHMKEEVIKGKQSR